MVFGFVFAFAANFLNFAMHGDKGKKEKRKESILNNEGNISHVILTGSANSDHARNFMEEDKPFFVKSGIV
jgi:hypothetical protein